MRRLLTGSVAALALAGCGSTASTRVTSNSLAVYASLPLHGPRAADSEAMVRGMKLALQEAGGSIGGLKVGLVVLDDVAPDRDRWSPEQVAGNARQAVRNPSTVAYFGDLDGGATAVSLPITNAAGILQIAPWSSLTGLTRPADRGEPEKYYPSGRRSFARLVPSGAVQARALASWIRRLGARRVAVAGDGSHDGRAAVRDLERALGAEGLELVELVRVDPGEADLSGPAADLARPGIQAVVVAGSASAEAGRLLAAVRRRDREVLLFAAGGLPGGSLGPSLAAAADVRVVDPVLDLAHSPPPARRMAARYEAVFGAVPPSAALYGYEAMRSVLQAIRDAGPDGNDRAAITTAFLRADRPDSVLGPYRLDARGDPTRSELAGLRIRGGRPRLERLLPVSPG